MKKILWFLLAAAIAAGVYFYGAAPETAPSAPKGGGVQTVVTTPVAKKDFPILIETTGTTVAANVVDVRPQVTNVVRTVHVRDGQAVRKGDLLFTLDTHVNQASLEKALAAEEDAKRQLARAQELVKQNFVSQSAVDTALTNAKSATAAVRAAQAQLAYDTIRSPIDGRIGIINVFTGSLVTPGNTVSTTTTATATTAQGAMATITQIDPIHVQFTIPESRLAELLAAQRDGHAATISFELAKRKHKGTVFVIDNQVDAAVGSVKAKARVDNREQLLLPGQFVRLVLSAGVISDALVVPTAAIFMTPRGEQLYVVGEDETVSLKPIKVVTQFEGTSVITGVNAGDRVVVEGKQSLRPGGKVREAAAKPPAGGASGAASAASGASAPASQGNAKP
jgi:RND family efflux transporter MFP subunit